MLKLNFSLTVKFIFLFCLNLIEWVGFTATITTDILNLVWDYQLEFLTNDLLSILRKWYHRLNLPALQYQYSVHFMVILGSLCMYLSEICTEKLDYIHKNSILDMFLPIEFDWFPRLWFPDSC